MTQEWEWDGQGWLQHKQNWRWRTWTPDENSVEQAEVPSTSEETVQTRNAGIHCAHHDERVQMNGQEISEGKESIEVPKTEPNTNGDTQY